MECHDILTWLESLLSKELISAFIGAIIGGLFTMWATTRAHKLADLAQHEAHLTLLYDTTRLIEVEISTAITVFMEEYGNELLQLPEDEPCVDVFPIGANPFPIYDSSPACLSRLQPELSGLLVRLYMRAKGLITMVELNNADSERARELAEAKLHEQVSKLTNNEVLEAGNRLKELYVMDTHHNAEIMGMGMTANGMKGLIQEIQTLLQQAKTLIDQLPKPKNRE